MLDTSDNESGFRIERRLAGGTFSLVATTAANATTYLDTELAAATTYEYRLQAFNIAGASAYSNTASATTPAADVVAPTPAITSPTDDATVSDVVTVAATATDDVGLSALRLSVDGVPLCATTQNVLRCNWNTRKVAIGAQPRPGKRNGHIRERGHGRDPGVRHPSEVASRTASQVSPSCATPPTS